MSGSCSMALVPLDIRQKHNKLLVDLCDLMCIDGPSYKNFVGYLHNAALPAGRLQRVKEEPMEVFHLMEERGILKEGDYSALEEALDTSGYKQALELVKKVGSEIKKQLEGQWSSTIAIQETINEDDEYSSNMKRKTPIQESRDAADCLPSKKKRKSDIDLLSSVASTDDKDSYVEETYTIVASKDITPSPQPASLFQSKSPSVQVAAVIPQLPLIRPPSAQFISSRQHPSVDRSDLIPFGGQANPLLGKGESGAYGDMASQGQAGKNVDDKDSHLKETDTTAASKDITPSPQPASIIERISQSIQVFAPTPQPSLISPHTPQFISTQPVLQPSVDKSDFTQPVFGERQGQARNSAVLQDEMEILEAIKNNTQKIEQMIRSKRIPKRSVIETVVKQDGYSKNIQVALREMSNLLRAIPESVGVWCGYKPNDPFNPVFVVTLKSQNCILKKTEILELFIDYSIIIQYKYIPNDEERNIEKQYGSKTIRSEDVARLNNCIAAHTESLMKKHSNLSIIRACPVKSRGYLINQMDVIEKTCIVLYVPVKGIIPVGEKEFPTEIDGIATDVREGEFYIFGSHNAMEYHQKLRMGCGITGSLTGTLGGFVDLPDGKIGCLTAAHVVLDQNQIQQYINLGEEEKRIINNDLARGSEQIKIYQPKPEPGLEHFGRVHAIALDAGNIFSPSVDAAIIEITDDKRKPEMGNFPHGHFEDAGFTTQDPMFYASGGILDDIHSSQRGCLVIKYGCTTGITRGCMEWIGVSVRPVDTWNNYIFPVMFRQLEVKSYNFAVPGDSGALVFLCLGGNIQHLLAVGMIMGGSSTGCQCFITPIKDVFEKLGLKDNRFKVFPRRELSQQEPASQPLIEPTDMTEHLTMVEHNMNERLMMIEQNINESFRIVEQNLNESMNQRFLMAQQNLTERFMRIEHNMNENVNGRFNRLEDLLNRLNNS